VGSNSRIGRETSQHPRPELSGLGIADPPERWEALGFVVKDSRLDLGTIRITLGGEGRGITRWAIRGIEHSEAIDGLPTAPVRTLPRPDPAPHPNGATGIDHVVIVTPDFDRTAAELNAAGIGLRRIRQVGSAGEPASFRQGFRRLGPAILELVEAKTAPSGPATFWGLVVIVNDLGALAERLKDHLGPVKPAVQPGRQIAALRVSAGLGQAVAFMDPEAP
jgi:hypothetical protein